MSQLPAPPQYFLVPRRHQPRPCRTAHDIPKAGATRGRPQHQASSGGIINRSGPPRTRQQRTIRDKSGYGLSDPSPSPNRRLDTWKEIGAFFGRDERTVKRWETTRGLPVHRVPGAGRANVYAYTEELAEWLSGAKIAAEQEADASSELPNRIATEPEIERSAQTVTSRARRCSAEHTEMRDSLTGALASGEVQRAYA